MGVSAMRGGAGCPPAGWEGQALAADAPQLAEIVKLAVLPAEAEGAGGHHNGVFQADTRQGDGLIHGKFPLLRGGSPRNRALSLPVPEAPTAHRLRLKDETFPAQTFQSTSPASNTGPSLHTCCMVPSAIWMAQPRQAPTPQAIRSSMDTWQGTPNSAATRRPRFSAWALGPQARIAVKFLSFSSISLTWASTKPCRPALPSSVQR